MGSKIQISLYKQISEHVAYSYGSKLICIDDKFSKPFKSYLGEDAVSNTVEEANTVVK